MVLYIHTWQVSCPLARDREPVPNKRSKCPTQLQRPLPTHHRHYHTIATTNNSKNNSKSNTDRDAATNITTTNYQRATGVGMQGCKGARTQGEPSAPLPPIEVSAGDSILLPDASNSTTRHYHWTDQDAMIIVLKFGKPTDSSNRLEIQQELQFLTDQL